jgi:hypothetical protein
MSSVSNEVFKSDEMAKQEQALEALRSLSIEELRQIADQLRELLALASMQVSQR